MKIWQRQTRKFGQSYKKKLKLQYLHYHHPRPNSSVQKWKTMNVFPHLYEPADLRCPPSSDLLSQHMRLVAFSCCATLNVFMSLWFLVKFKNENEKNWRGNYYLQWCRHDNSIPASSSAQHDNSIPTVPAPTLLPLLLLALWENLPCCRMLSLYYRPT